MKYRGLLRIKSIRSARDVRFLDRRVLKTWPEDAEHNPDLGEGCYGIDSSWDIGVLVKA